MIKFEYTKVMNLEAAIRGMRRPMNSLDQSDSLFFDFNNEEFDANYYHTIGQERKVLSVEEDTADHLDNLGKKDLSLASKLSRSGRSHAKYRRMIVVSVDITAPLYWWKEFDTYKVGTVENSESTMHTIHAKEFTLEDFSCEHLILTSLDAECITGDELGYSDDAMRLGIPPIEWLEYTIKLLNKHRELFLETKDKRYWWQMIQLLPTSYNQTRTVAMNYEVLANIYPDRKDHKLDEWHEFCDWIKSLPYSELITLEENDG